MEAALVSGFIKTLLPRLCSLVEGKYKLHKGLKSDIKSLEEELRMIVATIDEQILPGKDQGAMLSLWIVELRDLAHQIEDSIDRFLYQLTQEQQASLLRRPKTLLSRQRLAAEVQRLKEIAEEAHQRKERYMFFAAAGLSSSTRHAEYSYSSGSGPHTADLVGIDGPRDELVQQLTEEAEGLKVISIVGIHGSGKTVLAREVYDSPAVVQQFSLRAWVSATDRGPRDVLMEILRCFGRPVVDSASVDQLTIDLRKHLRQNRYFIVIDDMQTDEWSTMEAAFPEDNVVSSRVMVTTTIQSVANACSSSNGYVHKMKRLGGKHSEQLFIKEACPTKYLGYTQPELKEVLKKCDGQPLALVTMGQFLRKNDWPTGPNCEDACRDLRRHLEQDDTFERMRRVLFHSFSSLPGYSLKACLLYFGMFPADHPIKRKRLMRQWLAEGFVEAQPSSSENFNTLIDRNIIEPIGICNDQVKTCKTYGMMHEFILLMSTSQDFITLLSANKGEHKYVRRLSLHHHSATSGSYLDIDLSFVRSLIVFGEAGKTILSFQKYQLLRILDLEQCTDLEDDHLKDICNLFLLKYLSLGETIRSLPREIKKLKFLETLDLRRTKVKILPIQVLLLPCLLHLFGKFQLSDKVKMTSDVQKFFLTEQSNLQTLAGFVTDGCQGFPQIMSYMMSLIKLKIWLERTERSTNFNDLMNAVQKFIHDETEESSDPRSLSLHFNDGTENILNSLKAPCYLRSLKLKGPLLELPQFVMSMRGLRELCLSSKKLTAGLLAALAILKDLQHLKLIADVLEDFVIENKAFPRLQHLCFVLQCATLPTIEEGAFPYLSSLKLICKDLVGLADIKINRLICLKEVSLDHRVALETRESWEKAAKEHPNRPKILLVNAADESENEAADCSVASTPAVSEAKETFPTSELAVQEDGIQIKFNQGPPAAPEKQKNMLLPNFVVHAGDGESSSNLCHLEYENPTTLEISRLENVKKAKAIYNSEQTDNVTAVSSSLGAMGPLFRKLDLLLAPKYPLRRSIKHAIKLLKEDLEDIVDALVEQSMMDSPNHKAKYWMHEARELSYHIEDVIDTMMLPHTAADGKAKSVHGHKVARLEIGGLPNILKPSTRMARIAELRTLLREASERYERYQLLDGCVSNSRYVFSGHSVRTPVACHVAGNLVGIDGPRNELNTWLTDQAEQQLKIICVVGPAGVGKTALAKQLYRELRGQFECRAFMRVPRKPHMSRLLWGMLSQIQGPHKQHPDAFSVQSLIHDIRKHLQNKRYFIVIDGLWEPRVWDIMNSAFPKGHNCSRIIITCEVNSVAVELCSYQSVNVLELKPLGSQDSEKLFFDRICVSDIQYPDQLKEVSCRILRESGGLPLAAITFAGLLASQLDNSDLWYHLREYFISNLADISSDDMLKAIVDFCYDSLPQYLKTCLLYITMYPEGCTIRKVDLVKQWIAEGFISATAEGKQRIAESYFNELVNRGMIQPEKIIHSDEVMSCTVHHIVFDLLMHKSREENFITAVDYSETTTEFCMKAHRLSLHFSRAQYAEKPKVLRMSQVRSLAFFGLIRCMPSAMEFKVLRVLILEMWPDCIGPRSLNLSRISKLFHLRYLKISSYYIFLKLQPPIQGLKLLETLEIDARVSEIDISCLPGLLHLSLHDGTKLPDGIKGIISLQTLQYFDLGKNSEHNIRSLGGLINLRDLHITCSTAMSDENLKRKLVILASSLGRLDKLKSVTLDPGAIGKTMFVDHPVAMFSTASILQRLELLPPICIFSRLPEWIGELKTLRILKIAVRVLLTSDIDILTGLPDLTVLSLCIRQPNLGSVVFSSGALPVLKYFKYTCRTLSLAFEEEALPNLQRLKLCFNIRRGEHSSHMITGIERLSSLKEIAVNIGAAAGAKEDILRAAEPWFKDAIHKHPRLLACLNVKNVGRIEEESRTSGFVHGIIYCLLGVLVLVIVVHKLFWY